MVINRTIVLRGPQHTSAYDVHKRLFDIILSLLGLLAAALPMALIALAVWLDSPGGALYRQERLGKDGRPFTLIKFRSMRLDAEKNGAQWCDKNDARITRLGRFLRKSRLDELPQLINILRGDMSFVGPRPERACFYDEFRETVDGFDFRLRAVPGLTGYAQISGGYDLSPAEKLVYDMAYIRNRSLRNDLRILIKTAKIVFSHDGAR